MKQHLSILGCWIFLSLYPTATSLAKSAASRFKAPNTETPANIRSQWESRDTELWSYVADHVPTVLDHTGTSAFDEHLKGVQAVLRYWKAPEYLARAGLFHSIYGTEGFQGFSLSLSERPVIQKLIGREAERLCWWFCMVDRSTLDATVMDWKTPSELYHLTARPELGRFPLVMTHEEWLDFVELTLADWLEQAEGAASKPSELFLWKTGEAYSYRRLAYRKMAEILGKERSKQVAQDMLEAVMATEDDSTKHLVQWRTPPMSAASAQALEALRASGEDIPLDLSPQGVLQGECDASVSSV